MTDTLAFSANAALASHAPRSTPAASPVGSKLYETWVASAAQEAMLERRRARKAAEREYRMITAAAFPAFLAVAAAARLMPEELRRKVCGVEHRTVLGDARAMVAAAIPMAFMA